METHQIAELLNQTLSPDVNSVRSATDALDRLSTTLPSFPFYLLSITTGGESQGVKVAAATYLKNFTRRNFDTDNSTNSTVSKDLKDALVRVLLQAEPVVLKVLIEPFRCIVAVEFVKNSLWPELVPELRAVLQNSDLINRNGTSEWKTINALTVLHSVIRPFQYFLNPKLPKEPVPPQLELIAQEILVPLLALFHQLVEKVTKVVTVQATWDLESEKILVIVSKCIYFAVRSHMPSALASSLPALCKDLLTILNSLSFEGGESCTDEQFLRLKTVKRSLIIFCALVTRHRKFSDKLLPDITDSVLTLVKLKHSAVVNKLDFLSERIISLSFDFISRVLETGPGWRLISAHFTPLLDFAIFPTLVMNEKDITEWEEDPDEYMRKNLPSELEEVSGWSEDLFTARKSALNLLGVIAMSKGPPLATSSVSSKRKKGEKTKSKNRSAMGELLVLPFLSKFPIPASASAKAVNEYYGVLMAYSSLVDFLREQKLGFTAILIQNRLLPLYKASSFQPYLVASANWVLGELASCIPEELSPDIYSSLMKALTMPDMGHVSCYPVRMSAAGAIAKLVEVVALRIKDEEDSAPLFQLLGTLVEAGTEHVAPHIPHIVSLLVEATTKCITPDPEPWPQMVERGLATLAVMGQCWEDAVPEEIEENGSSQMWASGQEAIKKAFSDLLQHAWLRPLQDMGDRIAISTVSPSCIDDSSTLLGFIMRDVAERKVIVELQIPELLLVWSNLIADWHAWEEMEDLAIFKCIKEAVSLNNKVSMKNFILGEMPSPPAPPVHQRSVIEGIGSFVTEAFYQYSSAVWRASACVQMLLHIPCYTTEGEEVRRSLVSAFSQAAFSRFRDSASNPCALWKPLLLAISSCYLCYSDIVEKVLEKTQHDGFTVFASTLAFILTSRFEHSLATCSEIKLAGLALAKVVERLGNQQSILLQECLISLMEACLKSIQMQGEEEGEDEESEDVDSGDEDTEDDEDSEIDECEETEEEYLERCAAVAKELENETIVEEGDIDDEDQEIELGVFEEVDVQMVVVSLIERYHGILLQANAPPSETISDFLNSFPECKTYFQQLQG
ncbi:hypothetical protein ACH5RR_030948 [Cinchona calisaya]|uniref:Importin N-terminal domain-containing protein n=1 Tax=Cinchona calisaya TaxID=153742 RepID=A0ABD2YDS4_9GENT